LACLTGPGAYEVQRLPGGNSDSGSIVVRAPFTPLDIARVSASRQSAGTQVDITMWGRNLWDAKAAIAMADAITFNVVACHSYMPAAGAPKKG
jgi:L-alanine-DL-glutamate epimerase-like enolase superfamily enzyme